MSMPDPAPLGKARRAVDLPEDFKVLLVPLAKKKPLEGAATALDVEGLSLIHI